MNKTVWIVGSATFDTIRMNAKEMIKPGGVVTYAGMTFKKEGIHPTIITNIAREDTKLLGFFENNKIPVLVGVTKKTTRFINVTDGDSRRQEVSAIAQAVSLPAAKDGIGNTNHIHLGPLFPDDIDFNGLDEFLKDATLVSLDVQGYLRKIINKKVFALVSPKLPDILMKTNSIKADINEMKLLCDSLQLTAEEILHRFAIDEILVTMGEQGGYILSGSGRKLSYPAHPVKTGTDTTGAGDIFYAIYLSRHHHYQKDRYEALQIAAEYTALYLEEGIVPELNGD